MKWAFKKNSNPFRSAFTLIEVSVALIVLGVIMSTVLVIINRAMDTVVVWQTKTEAFEICRNNMEQILTQSSVSDMTESGYDEANPDIEWEKRIESFYEPITNRMWIRAVCSATFADPNGGEQTVELAQWLSSLSKQQIAQIVAQQQALAEYEEQLAEENPEEPDEETEEEQEGPDDEIEPEHLLDDYMRPKYGPPEPPYEIWDDVPIDDIFRILFGS